MKTVSENYLVAEKAQTTLEGLLSELRLEKRANIKRLEEMYGVYAEREINPCAIRAPPRLTCAKKS